MGTVNATELAHYVINECTHDDEPVSNLQLQGMLYVMQLVRLSSFGEPLFDDEFRVMPFGPAVPSVYREFSSYGGRSISLWYDGALDGTGQDTIAWIDEGIRTLRCKSPYDIASVTRSDISPWRKLWRYGQGSGARITMKDIMGHADALKTLASRVHHKAVNASE